MINQQVNQRYEVVEKIGDSPLFSVYKARDKVQSRFVTIKTVTAPFDELPEFLASLKSSMAGVAGLRHLNIAQFFEFGVEGTTPYVAVEYVRGINLHDRIRRIAPFSLSVAIDYACAMGEALNYSQTLGISHGDLRPQNVIISPEGAVKITDFGVHTATAASPQALSGVIPRMAAYKAPELKFSDPGTGAGDIYALGVILYEMLTGTTPYAGDDVQAVSEQHAYAAIPSPRTINPGVPRSVEGIIVKCLQKRPEERYRAASEMLNDLKSVRDALRFGKSLSWTPIDIEKAAQEIARPAVVSAAAATTSPVSRTPPAPRTLEPVAEVAASSKAAPAANQNRLRREDESLSLILKVLIAVATGIIFFCLVAMAGIYMTKWVVPKQEPLPVMVGRNIEEVRLRAKNLKVTLREHGDYMDRPRNIVYKTDPSNGELIRAGHVLNVWYSKGQVYVNVPDLVNLQREDAEQKLKDAGLSVGIVTPEYNDKIPRGAVIKQDVSFKKRVMHDTAVGLIVSDGPKPDYADLSGAAPDSGSSAGSDNTDSGAAPAPPAPVPTDPASTETHVFERNLAIKADGGGTRQVRIEYVDADGEHTPVIDEPHKEGDRVPLRFEYRVPKITLRAFYNDVKKWEMKDLDPEATKNKRIDNPGGAQ